MNFGFTEEQELLRAEVRKFLDQNCALEEVRKIAATPEGVAKPLFDRMAELGWVGLTLPDRHGGIGLGWVDLVVVLEETGRSLFPSPLIATVLGATAIELAGSEAQQKRWLPPIGSGRSVATLALLEANDRLDPAGIELQGKRDGAAFFLRGEKLFVMDAGSADLFDRRLPLRRRRRGRFPGAGRTRRARSRDRDASRRWTRPSAWDACASTT